MRYLQEEIIKGEIWVGNTIRDGDTIQYLISKGMRTARLGNVALCIEGKRLSKKYAPLFIGRTEERLYDIIMMKKTFGENYRPY